MGTDQHGAPGRHVKEMEWGGLGAPRQRKYLRLE